MDIKKMRIKNSQLTMTTLLISIIAIMFIFITMFTFFSTKLSSEGVEVPAKYNDSYTRILDSQTDLQNNVDSISEAVTSVSEADDVFSVALNGFKGLGSVLLLFLNFVSTPFDVVSAIIIPLDFIPQFQKTLILMAIVVVVVFLVIANAKGEPRT